MAEEPQVISYYQEFPSYCHTIEKLNEEYNDLEEKYEEIKKELEFYKSAFKYPHSNSVVHNLIRVTKNGEPLWIDRIKTYEYDLVKLDQCDNVKYLIANSNPRCER